MWSGQYEMIEAVLHDINASVVKVGVDFGQNEVRGEFVSRRPRQEEKHRVRGLARQH